MKSFLTLLLLGAVTAQATENPGTSLCGPDSTRTAALNLSTGIDAAVSETTLYASGYGGNSYYTTANNNTDAYWVIGRLSSSYTTRGSSPLPYATAYLQTGDHPYVINTSTWTPVYEHWASYTGTAACTDAPVSTTTLSRWLSVYSDAGGQNPSITNQSGDPYILQRCFRVCSTDSFAFSLRLMADDIIDSVWVDNKPLYGAVSANSGMGYYCASGIAVAKTLSLSPGRHWLRVAFRDNMGGHVGLNVHGTVAAKNGLHLVKNQYAGACTLVDASPTDSTGQSHSTTQGIAAANANLVPVLSPNPNNGTFTVDVPEASASELIVTNVAGSVVHQQRLHTGRNLVQGANLTPGLYFVNLTGNGFRTVAKMRVQ